MINLFAETAVRKFLLLVLACLCSVVTAVFVARAEALKSGNLHEGERVAYLLPTDKEERHRGSQQHGIIAAVSDISTPLTWLEAKETCDSLTWRGFSDWSLPDKEELGKLFEGKSVIGGFRDADYWSSSTDKPYRAWSKSFVDGKEDIRSLDNRLWVRPIRIF